MKTELKIILIIVALALCGGLVGAGIYLPDHYREQGRDDERSKAKAVSDAAIAKRDLDLKDIEADLKAERVKNALLKQEHEAKFNKYVADVRAGRVPGLYINRNSVCAARSEEAKSTGRIEKSEEIRLPRGVEEGLFRFANDRDKIIIDFEAFKQEVRIAKCFSE